jgi:putative ABC transport system ATP-binding protein
MVTHDPRISDMADRILNMEDGRIFNALSELR